ncbi:MAG TPA: MMPL family transporter [Gaiellales bacterium]|nr:MMPL family transporter [Gaiellales bacterium]
MKTRIDQRHPRDPDPPPDATASGRIRATHLAARMGHWSATHRKTAIFGWLVFVACMFMVGNIVGTKQLDPKTSGAGESGHADAVLEKSFKQPQGDSVLIQSTKMTVDEPAFRAAIADVTRSVSGLEQVKKTTSPLIPGNADQISKDRHSALVTVELRTTDLEKAKTLDEPVEAALTAAGARHPGISVEEFGLNAEKQLDKAIKDDFLKAGVFSIPVTLIILIIAFGALVAAGLPLLLALSAVFATIGLLAIPSQVMPLDQDVGVVVLLIGLAVGVDYSMFYLKREREERAAGRSERAALEAAAATSGRSVLVSGLTVLIAMAGMLFTGDKTFMGFGVATMFVVAIAVLGSLTVLPATLAALGDNVNRLKVPFLHRLGRGDGGGRMWSAILDRVLRRPLLSAVLAGGFLVALAVPAVHLHIASPGFDTLPQDLSAVQTYKKLQKAFPGDAVSAQVVVKATDVTSPEVAAAIADLQRRAIATGQLSTPTNVERNRQGTVAVVSISMPGNGIDSKSMAALATLRGTVVPATVGGLAGADVAVTGETASEKDTNDQLIGAAPFVFAFVLGFAFLIMLVTFRSIVIATKTVVLNLLSVGAAYGVLVLVFQDGWGKNLLGITATGGIIGWLPAFLFVILFGLSMDYHVFILSRIREAHNRGMNTNDSISHGIEATAGVVTSAALVMVAVFSIFATLQFMFLKQCGVGLAAAVLIDATVVRAVLLPASMKLLGDWNWYLPKWLEWLPHFGDEGDAAAPAVPEPPRAAHPPVPKPADVV